MEVETGEEDGLAGRVDGEAGQDGGVDVRGVIGGDSVGDEGAEGVAYSDDFLEACAGDAAGAEGLDLFTFC